MTTPSEDSNQPGHPPSLIRVFAVRMKKAWVLSYPLSAQRRLLIRLGGCPDWSVSSLGAHAILLVLPWDGSNVQSLLLLPVVFIAIQNLTTRKIKLKRHSDHADFCLGKHCFTSNWSGVLVPFFGRGWCKVARHMITVLLFVLRFYDPVMSSRSVTH